MAKKKYKIVTINVPKKDAIEIKKNAKLCKKSVRKFLSDLLTEYLKKSPEDIKKDFEEYKNECKRN